MELEVGLKISKRRDDITSISEFRIAKEHAGPVFLSRETDTMFILTAHLTGYKREKIDIKINEDGTEISISGEQPVQEMLMVGWRMFKKEVEIKGFRKVFKIPHGVVLDRIKAKYNEEESVFKIVMPKLVKGISGVRIEEVKEEGGGRGRLELEQSEADHTSNSIGETSKEVSKESEIRKIEETQSAGGKMLAEANEDMAGETIQKQIEESKIETENKGGESVREKVINEGFGAMKKSALDQNLADHITKDNGETSQEVAKLSEIQEREETEDSVEKMLVEEDIIGGTKQKEVESPKYETSEEARKVTELDQNVADHIPSNIDETDKEVTLEKTGESERMLVEANEVIAENKEPQIECEGKSKEHGREVGKGGFEAMKTTMEEFPQKVPETPLEGSVGSKMEETEDVKEAMIKRKSKEIECLEEKVRGEESKKMYVKPNRVIEKDITEETIQKGSEEPKIGHRHGDQKDVAENIVKGEFEASCGVTQEFPKQVEEMLLDGSKGFKETKMEETEEVTEAMAREKIKESECFMDKVEGDLESKNMHTEANEVIEKNTLRETFQKEIEESKTETNGNQQNLQENIVKGAFELLGTVIEEFPKLVEEAMAKKVRKEIEGTISKVKEEGSKKMHVEGNGVFEKDMVEETIQKETKETSQKEMQEPKVETKDRDQQCVQEDISKGSFEASRAATEEFPKQIVESSLVEEREGSKVTRLEETKKVKEEVRKSGGTEVVADDESIMEEETLQEATETKHPTGSEKGTPEREVQHTKEIATYPKVVRMRFEEVEEGNSKDKPELKELLPQEIQSKGTHVSEQQSVNQDILKVKRAKELEEGEQCTHTMDSTKTIGSIADQVAKPLQVPSLPSTQQSQVEETEEPKNEIDDIAQQSAQKELDHKGEIGRKETTGKELPKQDYGANVGPKAGRLESKGGSEATLRREKYRTAKNVKDEKARMKEEIQELDSEKVDGSKLVEETMQTTPEKEHHRKSEVVEKDVEPPEAAATHPEVTSTEFKEVDPKNDIEEPPEKELSPPRVEMQSKVSLEPEKSGMKWNFPKTNRYVPEVRERKGYDHGKEGIKTPEIVAYQAAKGSEVQNLASTQQSIVEEKGKSDRGIEPKHEASKESPKQKSEIYFQESYEGRTPSEDEEMDTLHCLEEKQKVDGREEAHLACKFPEKIQGGTKGPKMVTEDRGQQYMQENIDKKGFETNVADEELLKRGRGAETLLEKSEEPKTEETEEVSQQSLKRERARTTKTALDKKAEVKKIAETMQENPERDHQRESAKATLEIGEKPSKATATRPKAATGEFEDVKPNNETGKSQTEELSPPTMEVQSRVPHESAKPSMKQKILERKGVQQETERKKPMHVLAGNEVLEAENPKREVEPAEGLATHSKATHIEFKKVEPKGESDKQGTKELTSPFVEMLREEPYELAKPSMKQDTSKAEILQQVHKGKELIHSLQGTKASEARADKVDEPSKLSSPPSTQQFEVKGKGKTDECCEGKHQESQESEKQESKMKADQEVEQTETSKPEFPTDQQFIKDDQQVIGEEESRGRHEIEEETANEQGDEASEDNLEESVKQKDLKAEASGEKKDDKKSSNKLRAPLIVAGSAFLISLIVFFIRHKRARKSTNMQIVLKRA